RCAGIWNNHQEKFRSDVDNELAREYSRLAASRSTRRTVVQVVCECIQAPTDLRLPPPLLTAAGKSGCLVPFFDNSMKQTGSGAFAPPTLSHRFVGPALARPAPIMFWRGRSLGTTGLSPSFLDGAIGWDATRDRPEERYGEGAG